MTTFEGADISHYQNEAGPINWQVLKNASVGNYFACKATQRAGYLDPYFKINREQSQAVGFQFRLFYHWLSPTTEAAIISQVDHFLSKVGHLDKGEGWMLDAEQNGITASNAIEFCDRVEQKLQRPGAVYTGAYVAGLWTNTTLFNGKRARHLAAYTTEAKAKQLPGVAQFPWDFWQYSSNGPVPGIVGRCDMNRIDNNAILASITDISEEDMSGQPYFVKANVNSDGSVWEVSDGYKFKVGMPYLQAYGFDFGKLPETADTAMLGRTGCIHLISPGVIDGIPDRSVNSTSKFPSKIGGTLDLSAETFTGDLS